MNIHNIYNCSGRHFKVYDSDQQRVLEHPSDTEQVNLQFGMTDEHLCVVITGYIETPMRRAGQKKRIDIYIMQNDFAPILPILKDEVHSRKITGAPSNKWKYGMPTARDGRQGVPMLVKLAETIDVECCAPIGKSDVSLIKATAIVDSEVPGDQQSKWKREGGSRQIHFGIFNGIWSAKERQSTEDRVVVKFPLRHVENDLVSSIEKYWVG